MRTPSQQPPDDVDPELQPLEPNASVPPRPEEEVADAGAGLYSHHEPGRGGQPYPPSPQPADAGVDAPTADMADPDYQPPDYPDQVDQEGAPN